MSKKQAQTNQKLLGFLLILFLTMTYKDMVWDPYFVGAKPAEQQNRAVSANGTTTPAVTPLSSNAVAPTSGVPTQVGPAQVSSTQVGSGIGSASNQAGVPSDAELHSAGFATLESENISLKVSLLGGRVSQFKLKNFLAHHDKESPVLDIVSHVENQPLPLGVVSGAQNDLWVTYRNISTSPRELVLEGQLIDGRTIQKRIALTDKRYLLDLGVVLSAPPAGGEQPKAQTIGGQSIQAQNIEVQWNRFLAKESADFLDSQSTGGIVWFNDQKALRETYKSFAVGETSFGPARWISTTDHYFLASLLSPRGLSVAKASDHGELFTISLQGEPTKADFQLIGSPKSYDILSEIGFGLERNIDFGKTGFLSAPLLAMLHLFFGFLGNYGLAIVALTIVVRLCLLPLNAASFKSMQAMQDLQPDVQRIKDTIQDKQQQQVAMMALYKQKGVNPLGGCLPMLLQLPIFLGLYSALLLAVELRHAPFALWISDLSAPEHVDVGPIQIPILVVLFVISMLYQQWSTPSAMDETQKKIMLIMPIVFGFVFFRHMPAGLTLYWLTSNIISIVQMRQLRKPGRHSPFLVTSAVAGLVFAFAFLLTKISGA